MVMNLSADELEKRAEDLNWKATPSLLWLDQVESANQSLDRKNRNPYNKLKQSGKLDAIKAFVNSAKALTEISESRIDNAKDYLIVACQYWTDALLNSKGLSPVTFFEPEKRGAPRKKNRLLASEVLLIKFLEPEIKLHEAISRAVSENNELMEEFRHLNNPNSLDKAYRRGVAEILKEYPGGLDFGLVEKTRSAKKKRRGADNTRNSKNSPVLSKYRTRRNPDRELIVFFVERPQLLSRLDVVVCQKRRGSPMLHPPDAHAEDYSVKLDRMLRRPDVLRTTGLSRSSLYRLVRQNEFPAPLQISEGAVAWRSSEVERWIATRPKVLV